jgi:hypothetical protein
MIAKSLLLITEGKMPGSSSQPSSRLGPNQKALQTGARAVQE